MKTVFFLFIYSASIIALYLFFKKRYNKLSLKRSDTIQEQESTPIYINPVFKIVYEKESLEDQDIPTLADFVINFNQITDSETDVSVDKKPLVDSNKVFVQYENIQFNHLIKIKL